MSKEADITFQDNVLFVQGELDFSNVMSVYRKSLPMISDCQDITVDFSKLKSSNSSGLALIIEWLKHANVCQKSIQFKSVSQDLISIAKVSGLNAILRIS